MPPQAQDAHRSKDALLAGATGLIGQALAAQWSGPGTLNLLVRRAVPARAHQAIVTVDFQALPALPSAETAYCALGTTIKIAGSQAAFRAVDFDAVLAFAQAARAAGVSRFAVVSSLGANARSRNFYSRVKGELEAAVATLGFSSLIIARPSLLSGDRRALGQPVRAGERGMQTLGRALSPLLPKGWRPIAGSTVARALLKAMGENRLGVNIIESGELQELGA